MMFADDIVICSKSKEQGEGSLERLRYALERRGMKVSCNKTEYVCEPKWNSEATGSRDEEGGWF